MIKENLPNVGDVIMSCKFPYGHHKSENEKIIIINGKYISYPITVYVGEEERLTIAAKTGKVPPKEITIELSAYDPSRATAKFVVEAANMQGGSSSHDPYPDGWHIQARRLNEDGSYGPNGEVISFYMTGHFIDMVEPKDVQIVGKMQIKFV